MAAKWGMAYYKSIIDKLKLLDKKKIEVTREELEKIIVEQLGVKTPRKVVFNLKKLNLIEEEIRHTIKLTSTAKGK